MSQVVFWLDLPEDPWIRIFSFLSPPTLCTSALVCRVWREITSLDEIWKPHCHKKKINPKCIPFQEGPKLWKPLYSSWYLKFKLCRKIFPKMQNLYNRLQLWIKNSDINLTLPPGTSSEKLMATAESIRTLLRDPNFFWPLDLYCWLLLTNGQDRNSPGLFGSYSYYNYGTDMISMSLEDIKLSLQKMAQKNAIPGLIPIAANDWKKMHFLVNNPQASAKLSNFERNQIVTSGDNGYYFPLAENFAALLEHHITQLETGNYLIRDKAICLFPRKNIPTAITNHVKISASPLFIPEKSTPGREYFWAYSISMSMDQNTPSRHDCQLVSRHWDITNSTGHTDVVDGPGVIGFYPKMTPGEEFVYESCCPLHTPNGTMGGSFQMKRFYDKQTFDAVVPTFTLAVPEMIREKKEEEKEQEKDMDMV